MAILYEYFSIFPENNALYPDITASDDVSANYIYENNVINNPQIMEFTVKRKGNRKYEIVDYHVQYPYSIISKKIYDGLCKIQIEGAQFIPAVITGKKNERYENYFYLHVYNFLSAMDMEHSVYKWDLRKEYIREINKLYIDRNSLEKIPLEKRLLFRLKENDGEYIFHKSIVDAIIETEPIGVCFGGIEGWSTEDTFKKVKNKYILE